MPHQYISPAPTPAQNSIPTQLGVENSGESVGIAEFDCAETTARNPDKKPDTAYAGEQIEDAEFVGDKIVHRLHQFAAAVR